MCELNQMAIIVNNQESDFSSRYIPCHENRFVSTHHFSVGSHNKLDVTAVVTN